MTLINIINVGLGNLASLRNWCRLSQKEVRLLEHPLDYQSGAIIIPGVCCAGTLMLRLRKAGFDKLIYEVEKSQQKVLGICAGFQVLGTFTEEAGGVGCLGLLPIETSKSTPSSDKDSRLTGWFRVSISLPKSQPVSRDFPRRTCITGEAYFNHQYIAKALSLESTSGDVVSYRSDFVTCFIRNSIYGFQFHPEKSASFGRRLLAILK